MKSVISRPDRRIGGVVALAVVASSFAASANAEILLTVGDSYPSYQGGSADYNSLSGLTQNIAPADTLVQSTPGMPAGLTTAGLTLSNAQGSLAIASASLSQGIIRGQANGGDGLTGIISRNSYANTTMNDLVTWHITDGAASALVGIHVHLDGIESGAGLGVGGYNNEMPFTLGGSFDYAASIVNNGNQGYSFNGPSGFNQINGWESYTITNASLTGYDFNGVIRVTDGLGDPFHMALFLNCYDNTVCNFSHTASVSFTLPTDVTFTSASGVFLTDAPGTGPGPGPVGGVPEPATWAMMLLGFAGLGGMMRRRRAATA